MCNQNSINDSQCHKSETGDGLSILSTRSLLLIHSFLDGPKLLGTHINTEV